jgi:hypothetical protein
VADFNQFGSAKPGAPDDPQHCAHCEAMLADALDGTLSAADQTVFDLHMVGCVTCSSMLADAQRGVSWLEMLKSPLPEPPTDLMDRILTQTSGQTINNQISIATAGPSKATPLTYIRNPDALLGRPVLASASQTTFPSSNALPFRARLTHGLRSIGQTMLQPRLAMTAAMAFFSVALTLNLTGVHFSSLRANDFKPSSIKRSCYEAKARVVRYSDNLRVVYELESRVHDLQHSADDDLPSSPALLNSPSGTSPRQQPDSTQQPEEQKQPNPNPDQKQPRHRPNPGSSLREAPIGNRLRVQYAQRNALNPLPYQVSVLVSPGIFKKQEGGLV